MHRRSTSTFGLLAQRDGSMMRSQTEVHASQPGIKNLRLGVLGSTGTSPERMRASAVIHEDEGERAARHGFADSLDSFRKGVSLPNI